MQKWRLMWLAPLCGALLTGCGAIHTSVAKRELQVQTQLSQTIYLEPTEPEQRWVLVDIRSTAPEFQADIGEPVKKLLADRGYLVTDSPSKAQYWLQVNVRAVEKEPPYKVLAKPEFYQAEQGDPLGPPVPAAYEPVVNNDYHDNYIGAGIDVSDNLDADDALKALAVLAIWAGAEYVGDQVVKDTYYTMVTDIQVAERIAPDSEQQVQEYATHTLSQGDSGSTEQMWQQLTNMRKYQTRVVSFANKANLKWDDAQWPLEQGLIRTLSGIF